MAISLKVAAKRTAYVYFSLTAAVVFLFLCPALFAQAPLYSIDTQHQRLIFYDKQHTYLAPYLMRSFESAYRFHSNLFNYAPTEKVTILLEDFTDIGRGSADAIPHNQIQIGIEPFNTVFETMPAGERMSWLSNHELEHVFSMDRATVRERRFRKLFLGKVVASPDDPVSMAYSFLTAPRRYAPRWYQEGSAVFLETWMSGGFGRTLGGYDEMVFRARVRDKARIYDVVGLESEGATSDFQVSVNSYLYGTRFMTYLGRTYGPESVTRWLRRTDESKSYFSSEFRNIFDNSLKREWSQWIESEKAWQNDNLAALRKYPITPLRPISKRALGSVSRQFYDKKRNVIYAGVRYPGQLGHIAAIDVATGKVTKLRDVVGASIWTVTSLAYDEDGDRIFYTTDNNSIRDLWVLDLKTRHSRRLVKNGRVGDLVFNPVDKSLWATRHNNGLTSLARLQPPYADGKVVFDLAYGWDVFDLDISPDGKYLSATMLYNGRQSLIRFDIEQILAGAVDWQTIRDFEYNNAANFVYSPDSRYLYGSSYYTGASNIFRVDAQNGEMQALSNAETGLFRPLPLPDGSLAAIEYTAEGFRLVQLHPVPVDDIAPVKYMGQEIVEKYPIVKSWKVTPIPAEELQSLTTAAGEYSALKMLRVHSLYPIVQGYKDSVAYGLRLNLMDNLALGHLAVTASYSPSATLSTSEKFHLAATFNYWQWKFFAYYNNADFYDLFGPTKNSRKGYAGGFEHNHILFWKNIRRMDFSYGLTAYGGMDTLPDYQNISTAASRMIAAKAALTYTHLEKSLGGVEDNVGTIWSLNTRMNYAAGKAYPRLFANYDHGFLTPINNAPIWIRTSVGRSFGDRSSPFANFYFGGFGNNYIDKLESNRYRRYDSFPGVEINAIGANNYAKGLAEWNLPAWKFAHLGDMYLYCNWARLSLFSSGLLSNMGRGGNSGLYANIGAQLDFRIVLFSYLNSTFSVGYAKAADRHGKLSDEVMVSLKIL